MSETRSTGATRAAHDRAARSLSEVDRARRRVHAGRRDRVGRWEEQRLRAELLAALEHYESAMAAAGAYLPYRLRAELDLYRVLGDG